METATEISKSLTSGFCLLLGWSCKQDADKEKVAQIAGFIIGLVLAAAVGAFFWMQNHEGAGVTEAEASLANYSLLEEEAALLEKKKKV
mmetsp:Transcript_4777/g.10025  ORF Transcript_4777/g.10025 Transcript_4777/m.10025 type:complete len:89 (-) Transcript_4777:1367-1633(-)